MGNWSIMILQVIYPLVLASGKTVVTRDSDHTHTHTKQDSQPLGRAESFQREFLPIMCNAYLNPILYLFLYKRHATKTFERAYILQCGTVDGVSAKGIARIVCAVFWVWHPALAFCAVIFLIRRSGAVVPMEWAWHDMALGIPVNPRYSRTQRQQSDFDREDKKQSKAYVSFVMRNDSHSSTGTRNKKSVYNQIKKF